MTKHQARKRGSGCICRDVYISHGCIPMQLSDGRYASVEKPLDLDLLAERFEGSVTIGA